MAGYVIADVDIFDPVITEQYRSQDGPIMADDSGNPRVDKQLFLVTCNLSEEEVQHNHPSLWEYFLRGIEAGVNDRYLCRNRSPWYAQEDRPPSPLLFTYMGRRNAAKGPFRFILNHSQATAANVYLMLYPTPMLEEGITRRPELTRQVWEALNRIPSETMTSYGRVYGGGLHKMEPKELSNVSADFLSVMLAEPR